MNKTGLTLATAHLATTHPPTDTGLRADPVDVGNAIRRALVKWIPDPAQRFLAAEDVHATLAATDPGPDQAWHHEADEGVVCAVCGEPWTCQGYVDQIEPDPGPDQADGGHLWTCGCLRNESGAHRVGCPDHPEGVNPWAPAPGPDQADGGTA